MEKKYKKGMSPNSRNGFKKGHKVLPETKLKISKAQIGLRVREKHHNWKGGNITVSCAECGKQKEVERWDFRTRKNFFCNRSCMKEWSKKHRIGKQASNWKGGKVETICKICGIKIKRFPCRLKRNGGKFCSHRCKGIWIVNHSKQKDTSIELAVEAELLKRSIPYMKQAPIEGIALVDFLLPNRIIVQCDGDYWHSLKKNKKRDCNQDFQLGFKGYTIYRFSGTEIRKSVKRCINKIVF